MASPVSSPHLGISRELSSTTIASEKLRLRRSLYARMPSHTWLYCLHAGAYVRECISGIYTLPPVVAVYAGAAATAAHGHRASAATGRRAVLPQRMLLAVQPTPRTGRGPTGDALSVRDLDLPSITCGAPVGVHTACAEFEYILHLLQEILVQACGVVIRDNLALAHCSPVSTVQSLDWRHTRAEKECTTPSKHHSRPWRTRGPRLTCLTVAGGLRPYGPTILRVQNVNQHVQRVLCKAQKGSAS